MKRLVIVICSVGLCALAMLSCEKAECTQSFSSAVQGNFWTADSLGIEQQENIGVFTAYGLGRQDSLIYNKNIQVEVFRLPLSPDFEERSFVLGSDSIFDTITFKYSSRLNLINTVCGFIPNYTIEDVQSTNNFIERIRLEDDDVNTDEKNNIKVYIK